MNLIFLALISISTWADLRTEPAMNTGDMATADVLRYSEWNYNQPMIPAPGWMRVGLTEKFTLQLDFMAWLFGIPSVNIKYALGDTAPGVPHYAIEAAYVYFNPHNEYLKDMNKSDDYLFIHREGHTGYSKLNGNLPFEEKWIFHYSFGVSYSEKYEVRNENRPDYHGGNFNKLWDPTAMLGLELRPAKHYALHVNVSYGETFLFMENRPRKQQLNYGFRWAPYVDDAKSFWRNMRVDFNAVNFYFDDAKETRPLLLPIYPYIYWQWFN